MKIIKYYPKNGKLYDREIKQYINFKSLYELILRRKTFRIDPYYPWHKKLLARLYTELSRRISCCLNEDELLAEMETLLKAYPEMTERYARKFKGRTLLENKDMEQLRALKDRIGNSQIPPRIREQKRLLEALEWSPRDFG